jgi:predicted MFS family arabinose efflux permease
VLTELGWRWTFLLPVPFAIAILAVAPRVIPRDVSLATGRRRYDIAGAVTITTAMLLLVRTVVEAPSEGWGAPVTVVSFAIVAALLALFVTIERHSAAPLVRLGILRSAPLVRANLGGAMLFGGYFGFQFVATLYLQAMNGWSAIETALAFLPAGLLVAFGAPRLGPIVDRFGTARIIAVGSVSLLAGYLLFLRVDATAAYVGLMLPTVVLLGAGFALSFPSFNIQAVAGVADHEQGLASGLLNTSFQVGGAIGLAIVSAVVTSSGGGGLPSLDGVQTAVAVSAGIAVLGVLVAGSALIAPAREPAVAEVET